MENLFPSLPEEKKWILENVIKWRDDIYTPKHDYSLDTLSEWKGYRFIPQFEAATAKRAYEEMKMEEHSVFVCSFPKTGTNWTMEVIRQIIYGADEKLNSLSKSIIPALPMLEFWKPEKLDLFAHMALPRKLFCTHLPEELLNLEKIRRSKAKVVVILRNPKDQAVSWFHFSKSLAFERIRDELNSDWPQFYSDYVQGKHRLITKMDEGYLEYILGYYKHKNDDNVMFLHFEDMKKEPQNQIEKLADFLDVKLTSERAATIAQATSFEEMRKEQEVGSNDLTKVQNSLNMLRKGQVGSWKDTFTVAQSELMDRLVEEKLGHLDLKFTYE